MSTHTHTNTHTQFIPSIVSTVVPFNKDLSVNIPPSGNTVDLFSSFINILSVSMKTTPLQ